MKDLEDFDPDIYRVLDNMLSTNIQSQEMIQMYYEHPITLFGSEMFVIELQQGGKDIEVNESNKKDYIKDIARNLMTDNIKDQILAFKKGLHDIIPEQALNRLNEKELGLHLAGMPKLDSNSRKRPPSR